MLNIKTNEYNTNERLKVVLVEIENAKISLSIFEEEARHLITINEARKELIYSKRNYIAFKHEQLEN